MLGLVGRYLVLAFAVVLLNFLLPRFLPGDPLDVSAEGSTDTAGLALTAEARARLMATYRLDQPLPQQFVGYLDDLARLDFGRSIVSGTRVSELIGRRIPWTLGLMGTAVLLSAGLGLLLGITAAWKGGRSDTAIMAGATTLAALPELLVALGLLLTLAVGAGWFPLSGGQTPFANAAPAAPVSLDTPFGPAAAAPVSVNTPFPAPAVAPIAPPVADTTPTVTVLVGWLRSAADIVWHLTLPALTLVISTSASFVLVTRGAAKVELGRPYVIVARAKGLPERQIIRSHLLPNAALPLVTLFGLRLGQVLGGAVVVERVFSVPGLGLVAYQAIVARDYPILQAVFLVASLSVLLSQFGLELAYRALVPRHAG